MNIQEKSTRTTKQEEELLLRYSTFSAPLGRDYQINNYDVMCGRGKHALNSIGNRRFRITCGMHLEQYLNSKTRAEKSARVTQIVEIVRSSGGHFVKQDATTKQWFEIGDTRAADKVGHALRDADTELRRKHTSKKMNENVLPASKKRKQQGGLLLVPSAQEEVEGSWAQLLDDLDCFLRHPAPDTPLRSDQAPPALSVTREEAAHLIVPRPAGKKKSEESTNSTSTA
jgi:hypothetical protein